VESPSSATSNAGPLADGRKSSSTFSVKFAAGYDNVDHQAVSPSLIARAGSAVGISPQTEKDQHEIRDHQPIGHRPATSLAARVPDTVPGLLVRWHHHADDSAVGGVLLEERFIAGAFADLLSEPDVARRGLRRF
jgi:hypothetical protein